MTGGDSSAPSDPVDDPSGRGEEGPLRRLLTADDGALLFLREVLTSVAAVVAVGLLLFAISGVWPPMVAVESGSMEPHMHRGDLVFITEPGRYAPAFDYGETGVVTYRTGKVEEYRTFGSFGSVVVFRDPERAGPPIIHRARFYVEKGENWYDEANPAYVGAENCEQLPNCPAPHAGFITKGDNNPLYDQASGITGPVRVKWITGIARVKVPYLGYVRLGFSGAVFLPDGATVTATDSSAWSPATAADGRDGRDPGRATGAGPTPR